MKSTFPAAARVGDPITSHEAAEELTLSGRRMAQAEEIDRLVGKHPGYTSRELSGLTRLDRYQVARRLSDLEHLGRVKKGARRVCLIGERNAVTWWSTKRKGVNASAEKGPDRPAGRKQGAA